MVKHIVIWDYNPSFLNPTFKAKDLKEDFKSLEGKIDGLISINFYYDILNTGNSNMILETVFNNEDDLANYQENSLHKAIGIKYKDLFYNRRCADYII